MDFTPKEVQCDCGHTIMLDRRSDWCDKCCRKVFYDPKEKRRNKISTVYLYTVITLVMFLIAVVFIELIATPMMNLSF